MNVEIKTILKRCGYPERVVVLDCETYFDQDYQLKKLSTYAFVTDKRFELLGWAIKDGIDDARWVQELPRFNWGAVTVVMHNAKFDALVLANQKIYPPFIIDTLDLARHVEPRWKNSLAALCERHNLPAKGDTSQFKGLHRVDFDGQKWVDLVGYACNNAERTYDLLGLLLPKLSNPAFELQVAEYTRNLFIKPILCFNKKRAKKLEKEMQAEIQKVLDHVGITEKEVRGNKSFELRLREALGSEEPPIKQGKRGPLLAIAKTDPGYSYLLNHPNVHARQLMEARVAVKSWPLHIKRIEKLCSMSDCAKGRLPIPLKYCGAHTGRWSGAEGINPQNLSARGHLLASQTRTLIEAPPGHMLVIGDFAQIEARTLDWLAEQNDMLRAFAEGKQIYANFASKLTGHKIRKPKKTDSKSVAEWYGNYRQMGKVGILGCGYGMGANRCMEYAKNTYGINLDHAAAEKIVNLYRRTHPMVVLFWEKIERAFRLATQTGQTYDLSFGLRFFREENTTIIQLPNTRRLYYMGAKVEGSTRNPQLVMPNPAASIPARGNAIYFWGGYLAENIVQAVSRDILAEAILKIEKLGVRIPLIVHDDMSTVVPEKEVETYRSQIEDIARIPPVWASDLPIDIEFKVSKRYCK